MYRFFYLLNPQSVFSLHFELLPVFQSARRRWVWLGVNLVTALLAAMVLYAFEATLDQIVATAVLFPIVMSMGGIAGTQAPRPAKRVKPRR